MNIPLNIKAIIFDYDGVLGNSTPFNTYACKEAAKMCGIELEESVYHRCAPGGATIHDIATCIVTHYGKPEMVNDYINYKKTFDTDYVKEVEALPGAISIIERLAPHYLLAVNTGTRHVLVDSFLNKFNLMSHLQCVIASEDIKFGKPHPESYLLTCQKIGFKPADCLVIEDGISGIKAATSAGCYVVGIKNAHPAEELIRAGCHTVITHLDEIKVPTEA